MILKAYVLAAEPAWIETSIRSYYDIVDEIVVSYDRTHRGWTGAPIPVEECLDRLRAIDLDRKLRLLAGDYARLDHTPIENDTYQRQCALEEASKGADWVLSLDTDEVLPSPVEFARRLREEVPAEFKAVFWPMRVFFRQTGPGRFLEVCHYLRSQYSEYPGPVASRPGVHLTQARRILEPCFRFDIRRAAYDPLTREPYEVHGVVPQSEAILHFSWARSEEDIRLKLGSWGHSNDRGDWASYQDEIWRPSPRRWMWLYNFHPVWPKLWPALRPARIPQALGPDSPGGIVAIGQDPAAPSVAEKKPLQAGH